jgi:alpha-amylase/alpha-mannosidase (GH57 family)
VRSVSGYEDVARVHVSFSGTLLEQLINPEFQSKCYGIVKLGDMLWQYRSPAIHFLATGYYHPVIPLIPKEDWDAQIGRWLDLGRHIFGWSHFAGFWPPELGFSMEMIPTLKKFGFEYVIVDSDYIEPEKPMRWDEIRYRPHKVKFENQEITVIPRDRTLSDAQEAGMDCGWFAWEVEQRTRPCDFPALVTTCSDGDNGGWFRNIHEKGNFWGVFYKPLLDWCRQGTLAISPIFITDYLNKFPPTDYVQVKAGAWNTGWHHGRDFLQWMGSMLQKRGLEDIRNLSKEYHQQRWFLDEKGSSQYEKSNHLLDEAFNHILRAETSCNFFWGSKWVHRAYDDLEVAERYLGEVKAMNPHLSPSKNNSLSKGK